MVRASSAAVSATERKRCAIYTRKSTTMGLEQEFNTLDAQREACEAYIRSQAGAGWTTLDDRYDDGGFTGANIDRPAFQRLLADIEAGRVDAIVVYKLDRISRSLLDFATVMNRLNRAGVAFVSVTQNFSTTDAVGRMTLNLLATFAEFEREQIGERTRDKIAASRRRGRWTGGPVPLGYRVIDKKLIVEESEAILVREMFGLYLQKRSALAVVQALNERGCLTKRYVAANGSVREPRAWVKGDILRLLRNPVYAGFMGYRGELHEGVHEAIVDRQTFELARALLDRGGGAKRRQYRNPDYVLAGILFCARCGSALTTASSRKAGREYRYYRCTKRDREGRLACPTRPMSGPAIEEFVAKQLREAVAEGDLARSAVSIVSRLEKARRELVREHDRLAREISTLAVEGAGGGNTAVAVSSERHHQGDGQLADVSTRLQQLERRMAEVEREIAELDAAKAEAGWVAQCLRDFDAVWDLLTPENQGRLLRAIVERVDVDEQTGEVRTTIADLNWSSAQEVSA